MIIKEGFILAVYIIVVFGMVVITSALIMYLLNKMEILNYRMILAVSLSSILAALLFPGMFNLLSSSGGNLMDATQLTVVMAATMALHVVLALLLSITVSRVIPDSALAILDTRLNKDKEGIGEQKAEEITEQAVAENTGTDRNYLEEIYDTLVVESRKDASDIGIEAPQAENNLEISVDSEEIIDKMRIETFEQDISMIDDVLQEIGENSVVDIPAETSDVIGNTADQAENLSLEDCVNEAFRLKSTGDCEGAILYFMYALDRQPDTDLAFWIVLDICVLYKTIGQVEFARDILSTYFDTYSGIMDEQVRDEIERNLIYMD